MSILIHGMELDGRPHKALFTQRDGKPVLVETQYSYADNEIKVYPVEEAPAADVRPVRWIPVSERLPDMNDYDWVLGVVSGKFGYTVFQNAVICVGYDPDFGFFLEEYPDVEITVTHWMPLPEAPKEVQE